MLTESGSDPGLELAAIRDVGRPEALAGLLRQLRRRFARQCGGSPLSYRELAARTGWAHGVIGDYFVGKTLPPTGRFDTLIRLLGATPAEQGALATARDRVEELRRDAETPVWGTVGNASTVPRHLPPDVSRFTGRTAEMATISGAARAANGSGIIAAVDGMGGVGKSALAVHAAHQLSDQFPDGQLYADLNGCAAEAKPVPPGLVLARLLRALGVASDAVPGDTDEASAMFRALTSERRSLVVLDNARDAAQVRPLLPASATCAVLVTSRQVLGTLECWARLHLDVPSASEAVALLSSLAGTERVSAELTAAQEVAHLCGYLPLALRIASARLVARPHWPIRALADRLRENRLEELQYADLAIRRSLQASYARLVHSDDAASRAAATAFPFLGRLPDTEFGLSTAASLLNSSDTVAELSMERLVDVRLLETPAPGRYRCHELIRLFATELAPPDAGNDSARVDGHGHPAPSGPVRS